MASTGIFATPTPGSLAPRNVQASWWTGWNLRGGGRLTNAEWNYGTFSTLGDLEAKFDILIIDEGPVHVVFLNNDCLMIWVWGVKPT